jgi:hypothetical protein
MCDSWRSWARSRYRAVRYRHSHHKERDDCRGPDEGLLVLHPRLSFALFHRSQSSSSRFAAAHRPIDPLAHVNPKAEISARDVRIPQLAKS